MPHAPVVTEEAQAIIGHFNGSLSLMSVELLCVCAVYVIIVVSHRCPLFLFYCPFCVRCFHSFLVVVVFLMSSSSSPFCVRPTLRLSFRELCQDERR